MRILVVFATSEGHTAKLSKFVARTLVEAGHQVVRHDTGHSGVDPDPTSFDRALVLGSLHAGEYQHALVDYVIAHRDGLALIPSAFISVSLSAAGHERRDWRGLDACLVRFQAMTHWAPEYVHHAAGAFRFTRYGFLTRFVMARIARGRGLKVDTRRDYDLTDYDALARFTRAFVQEANAPEVTPLAERSSPRTKSKPAPSVRGQFRRTLRIQKS